MSAVRTETLAEDVTLYLGDCREILPTLPRVDAVVSDPPYGILNLAGETRAIRKSSRQQGSGKLKNRVLNQADVQWDIAPDLAMFDMLRAMSDHQVFWGGNYFPLPPTRGILVWDKEQPWPNFSQAEIAWTSSDRPAALFRLNSGRGAPDKQHPTEKPLDLMKWCIERIPPPCDSDTRSLHRLRHDRSRRNRARPQVHRRRDRSQVFRHCLPPHIGSLKTARHVHREAKAYQTGSV